MSNSNESKDSSWFYEITRMVDRLKDFMNFNQTRCYRSLDSQRQMIKKSISLPIMRDGEKPEVSSSPVQDPLNEPIDYVFKAKVRAKFPKETHPKSYQYKIGGIANRCIIQFKEDGIYVFDEEFAELFFFEWKCIESIHSNNNSNRISIKYQTPTNASVYEFLVVSSEYFVNQFKDYITNVLILNKV